MDFMIDLETLGTRPGCMIVSVGVVAFDPKRRLTLDEFYAPINLESQIKPGLKIDPGTMIWWMKQDEEARKVFLDLETAPHIMEVFQEMEDFFRRNDAKNCETGVWGNGSAFDLPILIAAIEACDLKVPWFTFGDRCYRTEKNRRKDIKMVRIGTHHNALDDARSQTDHLLRIWEQDEEDRNILNKLDRSE